jgi:predicted MFS family arabinose efflux permease
VDDISAEQMTKSRLATLFVSRTALNTSHRVIYPFLPSISRGLGVPLAAASGLVTLRLIAGLLAPFLGFVSDRFGRRRTMEAALLIFALAGILLAGIGSLAAVAIAFTLYGLSKVLFDPAVHAYLGDTVPYARRGRAVGLLELSWSSAWLLGVPASGLLIERLGWRTPWAALAVLGLLGLWLIHKRLPPAQRQVAGSAGIPLAKGIFVTWRRLLRRRPVCVLLLTSLLLTLANEIPFIVYGAWLEEAFGLSLSVLGMASILVGLAEAAAEIGTTLITDRLGKRRSVLAGLLGLAASLVLLPWLSGFGLTAALTGVMLMVITFEFGIVSLIPLATELTPDARASLLSLNLTAFSLGRILGAAAGAWLWQWQEDIALHALIGATCALVAAFLLTWGMREIAA